MSKEARLPQAARQDAEVLVCEETVSRVTLVETSLTAIVSVDPIDSPAAEWDALKTKPEDRISNHTLAIVKKKK